MFDGAREAGKRELHFFPPSTFWAWTNRTERKADRQTSRVARTRKIDFPTHIPSLSFVSTLATVKQTENFWAKGAKPLLQGWEKQPNRVMISLKFLKISKLRCVKLGFWEVYFVHLVIIEVFSVASDPRAQAAFVRRVLVVAK